MSANFLADFLSGKERLYNTFKMLKKKRKSANQKYPAGQICPS